MAQLRTLYIGDLSCFCNEYDLMLAYQNFGEIVDIKIIRNKRSGVSTGYGFITFKHIENSRRVMQNIRQVSIFGRYCRVRNAAFSVHDKGKFSSLPQQTTTYESGPQHPMTKVIYSIHATFKSLQV